MAAGGQKICDALYFFQCFRGTHFKVPLHLFIHITYKCLILFNCNNFIKCTTLQFTIQHHDLKRWLYTIPLLKHSKFHNFQVFRLLYVFQLTDLFLYYTEGINFFYLKIMWELQIDVSIIYSFVMRVILLLSI